MIGIDTKIEDLVKTDTNMIDFFNKEKIDFCCNGHMTVEEVAKEKNIDANDLAKKIQGAIKSDNSDTEGIMNLDDFKNLDIKEMIDSLIIDHHKRERDLLFEIDPLLNKILSVHFVHHGEELMKLHSLFSDLKKELEEHFVKEEEIIYIQVSLSLIDEWTRECEFKPLQIIEDNYLKYLLSLDTLGFSKLGVKNINAEQFLKG